MDIKKTIQTLTLAGVLATSVALVGCAGAGGDATASNDTEATDVVDTAIEKGTEAATEVAKTVVTDATDWKEAKDAAEATSKAGLSGEFAVPEKLTAHGIEFSDPSFTYVSGIAQATYEQPASMVQVRKGSGPAGTVMPDDGTGYTGESFDKSWEVTAGDQTVTCYGNKEGEILFAQWYHKDDPTADGESDAYSVHPLGLGGEDIPMTEDELVTLVGAVK